MKTLNIITKLVAIKKLLKSKEFWTEITAASSHAIHR